MEIMLEAETVRINVGKIVFNLFNKVHALAEKVVFSDTHDLEVTKAQFPQGQDFIERMMMTQVPSGRKRKFIVGFYLRTKLSLADIKRGIGYSWLHDQNIFLRAQSMPFDHGLDVFLIGYWIKEHPSFMNFKESTNDVLRHWNEVFDVLGPDDDKEPIDEHQATIKELQHYLTSNSILVNGKLNIPVSLERNLVKVVSETKQPFEVFATNVYVPRDYKDAAMKLNDLALAQASTTTILPFALQKHEPEIFHSQMTQHAKYLHTHRNISIDGIDSHDFEFSYNTFEISNHNEPKPEANILFGPNTISLKKLLATHPLIYRIHTRPDEKLNISVEGKNFGAVAKWLDHILPAFTDYFPTRILPPNSGLYLSGTASRQTDATSKYSHLSRFSTGDTDQSFDASTISTKSARSNTWNSNRLPCEVLVDHIADFPPLQRPLSTVHEDDEHPTAATAQRTVSHPTQLRHQTRYQLSLLQRPQPRSGRGGPGSTQLNTRSYATAVTTPTPGNFHQDENHSYTDDHLSVSIANSEAAMNARMDKLEATFEAVFVRLTNSIQQANSNPSITTTTDQSVHSASSDTSTFLTKAEATAQYDRTENKMNGLQNTLDTLINSFQAYIGRQSTEPFSDPASDSPPRKIRNRDQFSPADSPMEEGVSED
jgi:hypothetical protein